MDWDVILAGLSKLDANTIKQEVLAVTKHVANDKTFDDMAPDAPSILAMLIGIAILLLRTPKK